MTATWKLLTTALLTQTRELLQLQLILVCVYMLMVLMENSGQVYLDGAAVMSHGLVSSSQTVARCSHLREMYVYSPLNNNFNGGNATGLYMHVA